MRFLLGISAFYHDSAAVLLRDGVIVAAAEEQSFSRVKHDARFPSAAIAYCLAEAGIGVAELDLVCFYEKPLLKLDRLLETYLAHAPRGFASFRRAMASFTKDKLRVRRAIVRELGEAFRARLVFTEHHEAHAASAFFPSPFERAAILTCDGVGEWATTSFGLGEGRRVALHASIGFPHSLGLLYSAFTAFCGFRVNSGESKLMGLAPYGTPRYAERIRRELIDVKDDGSYRLDQRYFTYAHGLAMTGARFAALFDGPPRAPEGPLTQREADLAASVQAVLEDVLLRMARHVHARTGADALCLAGGVALNCVANGVLARRGPFAKIFVQPAAGDSGAALGAALFAWHSILGRERSPRPGDSMQGALLGPSFSDDAIAEVLRARGAAFESLDDDALFTRTSELLEAGRVVGWFQGRMELGPRALGSRSILADPRDPSIQRRMNLAIKHRESFRPFAPCVLRERAHEFFEVPEGTDSPYMLFVSPVRGAVASREGAADPGAPLDASARLAAVRSPLPAITHVDGSARLQTVDAERHGRLRGLLETFERRTGCPVLVNTSFNVRGEPIVRDVEQALDCFLHTGMDALVLGRHLLRKEAQAHLPTSAEQREHVARFELD